MSAVLQVTFNDDGTAKFIVMDPQTLQPYDLTLKVTREQFQQWKAGRVIQSAMPQLTLDEREALITGVKPGKWGEYLGPPPEEEA